MSKLRAGAQTSPTTPKRWVWELIQNAKDVNIDGKVRVLIEADMEGPDAHVTFKHNGEYPFPYRTSLLPRTGRMTAKADQPQPGSSARDFSPPTCCRCRGP